jgi:hypothetical protein
MGSGIPTFAAADSIGTSPEDWKMNRSSFRSFVEVASRSG